MKKFCLPLFLTMFAVSVKGQFYSNVFNIQSSGSDRGMRVTTDNQGNVLAAGNFGGQADFDPGTGAASLTPGGFSEDVYVAKYDAALNYVWAARFGTSGSDFAYALATDGSNNVIVGGDISDNSRDGFVNKYDAGGNLVWSIVIGGVNKDVVYGVATDAANCVYVTGYFGNSVDFDPGPGTYTLTSNGGRDIFLAKYDSAGAFRWAFNIGGTLTTAYEEGGRDIKVHGDKIYLTGSFEGNPDFDASISDHDLLSNGSLDMFIAKYDTSGSYQWAVSMGSNNKHDYSYALDVDAAQNVYITGGFEETVDFDPSATAAATLASSSINAQDIFVAKYNSTGVFQWVFQVGGNTSVDDHAFDLDVTPGGELYISGEVWGPADFDPGAGTFNINTSNDQIFFAKYTTDGAFVWAFEIGSTSGNGSADNGYGVHAAQSGSLFVTGDYSGTADFNPGPGTATLSSNGSDAFIGVYGTAVFVGLYSSDAENASFLMFPNPSPGNFIVESKNAEPGEWNVVINDLSGKEILRADNIKERILQIQNPEISPGMYFCTVNCRGKKVTKKLIIQ